MARFCGIIGYVKTEETTPGVWVEITKERRYTGDILKDTRQWSNGDKVNEDLVLNNTISIVADSYAYDNLYSMRYIEWMGTKWKIIGIEIQRPRLVLTIGGIYNG